VDNNYENNPCVIPIPILDLTNYSRNWGRDQTQGLLSLARALAASPVWGKETRATFVIKPTEPLRMGLVGFLDKKLAQRFIAHLLQMQTTANLLRYMSYRDVEQVCSQLAKNLLACMGWKQIHSAHFIAIPRGGHIVLGMLSYLLNLRHDQLQLPPAEKEGQLIIVDDCAFTGARFRMILERITQRQVIFAPVWSHPELRDVIVAAENRVLNVISGADLHDYGTELMGDAYPSWRERWLSRSQANHQFYWFGRTEYLCFPWSEPDNSFWNPFEELVEAGWNYVPPAYCLEHRAINAENHISVCVQQKGKSPLRPSNNTVYATFDDQIIVGHLETGQSFQLSDIAAEMWLAIVKFGALDETVESLLNLYNVERHVLEQDISDFVNKLIAHDLLEDMRASQA
jgi:hypothetical protein